MVVKLEGSSLNREQSESSGGNQSLDSVFIDRAHQVGTIDGLEALLHTVSLGTCETTEKLKMNP